MEEVHKIYLYPVWLRIWHAFNALSIVLLIATGISMQYSNLEYALIPFESSVFLHNLFGVLTAINYLLFVIANSLTSNGKAYKFKLKGLGNQLMVQSRYYMFGYFKGEPKPYPISEKNKFNPLQRVSYIGTMYLLIPLVIITGIALLYPELILENVLKFSGIKLTALFHASLGFLISMFLFIHIYVASVGKHPLRNYKSIVSGFHED